MRKPIIILLCLALTIPSSLLADNRANEPLTSADSIVALYTQRLEDLVAGQAMQHSQQGTLRPNPYLFRLFAPGTLYRSALQQNMSIDAEDSTAVAPSPSIYAATLPSLGQTTDRQLTLNEIINEQLNRAYVLRPDLFATTQEDLMNTSRLRTDLAQKVEEEKKIAEKVIEEVPAVEVEAVEWTIGWRLSLASRHRRAATPSSDLPATSSA